MGIIMNISNFPWYCCSRSARFGHPLHGSLSSLLSYPSRTTRRRRAISHGDYIELLTRLRFLRPLSNHFLREDFSVEEVGATRD